MAVMFCTVTLHATIRYVDVNNATPTSPYTNWTTAATNIQSAVNVATAGDEILVTNGVYENGVIVNKAVTVRSVNGPQHTTIRGKFHPGTTNGPSAIRCAILMSNATLAGFTLTNGATPIIDDEPFYEFSSGGGVRAWLSSSVISNCIITGNSAYRTGGGAFGGTLINCTLANNTAWVGGGTARNTLKNCILTNNLTTHPTWGAGFAADFKNCTLVGNNGGGAAECALYNSIAYYNIPYDLNACFVVNNSCVGYGSSGAGTNGITNAPVFVDLAGGNLRLQSNSPCINAGRNDFAGGATDFDGNPRLVGSTVDMGAFEFQSPASALPYWWLQNYGLATDNSVDTTDTDGDGHNNWQEWRTDTIPTNPASALKLTTVTTNNPGLKLSWQSVNTRRYRIERSTSLGNPPVFLTIKTNLAGQSGATTYTDTNAVGDGPFYYRVGVQE